MPSSPPSRGPADPSTGALRPPLVEALAVCVRNGLAAGKLEEEAVDRALTGPARAWVEGACDPTGATPLADVESLVALVASQRGAEAELAVLADEMVTGWRGHPQLSAWRRAALPLVDGPGFLASQASEWLLVCPDWVYAGGRDGFALELRGLRAATPALRTLVGALVARLTEAGSKSPLDVRVLGIDGDALVIAGRAPNAHAIDPAEESRLHRAALAG